MQTRRHTTDMQTDATEKNYHSAFMSVDETTTSNTRMEGVTRGGPLSSSPRSPLVTPLRFFVLFATPDRQMYMQSVGKRLFLVNSKRCQHRSIKLLIKCAGFFETRCSVFTTNDWAAYRASSVLSSGSVPVFIY